MLKTQTNRRREIVREENEGRVGKDNKSSQSLNCRKKKFMAYFDLPKPIYPQIFYKLQTKKLLYHPSK